MQSIRTRFHGPGNVRGSYISAKCEAGSIRHDYCHALSADENHVAACDKMRRKLGWTQDKGYKTMVAGQFAGDWYWVTTHNASDRSEA